MVTGNSGGGKGKNNLHDPTLKEHERKKGVSGEAIHGEKKVANISRGTKSTNGSSP